MRELALEFYEQGEGCSQCILMAAMKRYQLSIDASALKMLNASNGGFGIGSMCSCLVGSLMVFSLLFDETTAKRLRLRLFIEFQARHQSLNCSSLKKGLEEDVCHEIVGDIAEITAAIIDEELGAASNQTDKC